MIDIVNELKRWAAVSMGALSLVILLAGVPAGVILGSPHTVWYLSLGVLLLGLQTVLGACPGVNHIPMVAFPWRFWALKEHGSSGVLEVTVPYFLGVWHGEYRLFNRDGTLGLTEEYRLGVRHGWQRMYTRDRGSDEDLLLAEGRYHYGEPVGVHVSYFYPSGARQVLGFSQYKDGVLDGVQVAYAHDAVTVRHWDGGVLQEEQVQVGKGPLHAGTLWGETFGAVRGEAACP